MSDSPTKKSKSARPAKKKRKASSEVDPDDDFIVSDGEDVEMEVEKPKKGKKVTAKGKGKKKGERSGCHTALLNDISISKLLVMRRRNISLIQISRMWELFPFPFRKDRELAVC
jgi:hypothetical protein